MTEQENAPTDSPDEQELRERARDRVQRMPAETALGNADAAGGGEGDPKDFPPEGNATS